MQIQQKWIKNKAPCKFRGLLKSNHYHLKQYIAQKLLCAICSAYYKPFGF